MLFVTISRQLTYHSGPKCYVIRGVNYSLFVGGGHLGISRRLRLRVVVLSYSHFLDARDVERFSLRWGAELYCRQE